MSLITAARPFAEAAFAVASKSSQVEWWDKSLEALACAYEHPEMQRALSNPSLPRATQVDWLKELAGSVLGQDVQSDFSAMFANFISIIAQGRSFCLLTEVSKLFKDYIAAGKNIKPCVVSSAQVLDVATCAKIEAALTKRFSQPLSCEYKVDPTLQAGVSIQAGDWVMDGTMLSRISKLSEQLLA
jgi:F-type H+-transporting ATPase subunit delta